ncbi:hypothetical protein ZYGR_0N00130 [Zygosaccharomyces rouxii]|uniref:ZYRO0D00704p n=2 Tax=Zygosaccharomyces rouxii TaxID=4956 RepID=C5DUR3_ZYGRC|nr:uncharacterized protein ZYRO0D00704g [Zygosaccharomyces rouxii]KAH9200449.1 Apc15p protein-domain-containing protein [Zygosaccharomyces rouxii]GAV48609.1 hypothetical protein ZYGR_0N00130 [Zygosaccharomyces rouxii]CAR27532.1 ZYRO0D00704p [Zygosaccharomyces rouxii]
MTSSVPLSGLPLFRDVKENLIQQRNEQQQQHQQQQATHQAKRRNHLKKSSTHHHYMPPLSAYNASEERPYYPGGRFDEMTMRIEMEQRRLNGIRNLGYNYIRPIGVGHTLQMIRERKQLAAKLRVEEAAQQQEQLELQGQEEQEQQLDQIQRPRQQQQHSILPSAFQENGDRSSHYDFGMVEDVGEDPTGTSPPQPMGQILAPPFNPTVEDEDEEEDEISYDYEAEFAQVEDEQNEEDEEDEYLDKNQEGRLRMLNPRGATRDFSIQQFVETSHMESHPYDMEDDYENPQLEVETNQGDSGDFTEVPWINISDTVDNVDSPRVSSLNSLVGHRMISSSTVTTNNNGLRLLPPRARRVSDNNSDQELI